MNGNDAKNENNNDELSQERKIVNDFKSELEKLKQKLAQDFHKFNEMEKDKEKEKETTTNTSDSNKKESEIIQNTNNKPINNIFSTKSNNNEKIRENILPKVNRENKTKKDNNSELIKPEIKTKEEEPTSIFGKVPSLEELKAKYGINFDEPKNNLNEKKNLEKENLNNSPKEIKENKENIEAKENKENSNKKEQDKYDLVNILNMKKNNDDELQNIFNRKSRQLIDIDDSFDDENEQPETNHPNEINNVENNNDQKNNINNKNIIRQNNTEEDEIDMINKYIDSNNNNNNNICKTNEKNEITATDINLNSNTKQNKLNIENLNNENNKLNAKDLFGMSDKKTDINNNNNNIQNNYHYTKINTTENENKKQIFSQSKSNNNITNNNNQILDTSLLNSKLDQQIKLINEKSENNRIEEEKNQLKIREIENSLQLDKRLTHNNREIRKNAIKELCEMCQNFGEDEEDKAKAFECFSPWVKYCLEETNSYVIPESLNFFILFNSIFPNFLTASMKDFFDNIERFVTFGISSINENCFKIIFLLFQDKKTYSSTLNEIFKLLNTSSMKMVKFLNGLLIIMVDNNIIQDNYVKILFEKLINIYVKIGPKLVEKRKIYSKLLQHIYQLMDDDWDNCKLYIKLNSYKELDTLFNKVKKNEKQIKYRLYPQNNNASDISINNVSNIYNYNNKRNDKNLNNKIKRNESNNNRNKKDNNNVNINNIILNNNVPDVNDILSVLPNEFFEYHFLTQFQVKIKLLEQTNEILNKIKLVKDKDKNLTDVYKTINYSIEDSNILIHLEGIKLLENICRLIQSYINTQKLKLLLETCFDKLKDKKSLVKNELFTLFNMIIENHCFEPDKFISFILQFCCNQKKENSIVKTGLLEYIKLLLGQENNVLFYEIRKIREKDYLNFTKKVITIIQKESLSSIKDLCSDLLIIFKRRIENIDEFDELISVLPNYRKKIIIEEENLEQEEGEYKRNLKRIKSSYSFSNTKYSNFRGGQNNMERSKSNARINNFERNEKSAQKMKKSISSSKNLKIKTNISNIKQSNNSKNKYNTKNNFRNSNTNNNNDNSKYQTGGFAKINNKKRNISSRGNISSTKNSSNNISTNNNDSKNLVEKNKNKNNKKENFNQKKENLLENIQNLDIDSIDKYSKMIIKDFFIFVNKVCSSQTNKEDLSYHFDVIFMIFEKIFYRIIELVNEQKQKQQIIKLKKLLDELISYISKAVVMTPCIDQIPNTKKFNLDLLEVFLDKIKQFCPTKEKFYMHLLLSLYKFCEQNQDFPKELNPKPSVLFFLKYVKEGYNETKSEKLLNILKEFISETQILNNEEKKLLDFNDNNNDNEEEENEDEEQENINIQKNLPLNSDIMNMPRLYNKQVENNINQINNNNIQNSPKINNNIQNDSDEENNENIINHSNKKVDSDFENDEENNNVIKNSINNNDDLDINQFNTNNIAEKLKQFEAKLNKIPKPLKDNIEDSNNNISSNNNNKEIMYTKISPKHNLQPLDVEENNSSQNMNDIKNNVYNSKSKLGDDDFQKIEESIRLMSKRLDTTLNKMSEASGQKQNSRKLNKKSVDNSIINQKEKGMTSWNVSKISENNITNDDCKNNLFNNNNFSSEQIIEKIIKVLKNEINDNEVYIKAKEFFINLNSVESKLNFVRELRGNFDNQDFIANIPINNCTNFFDFILSILSFQILNFSKDENIIINLQELAEYLLPFRKLNDMFIIMLFLLKKYFPKNLNNKIEDIALVMIKVISYLLKELLKLMNKENVIGQEIICEINDLFTVTPPSTLTTATPNALFYQHIFTLLKSITDQIVYHNKDQLENIIAYLQEKKMVCDDYLKYLIRLKTSN